jgi:hypothetical protein
VVAPLGKRAHGLDDGDDEARLSALRVTNACNHRCAVCGQYGNRGCLNSDAGKQRCCESRPSGLLCGNSAVSERKGGILRARSSDGVILRHQCNTFSCRAKEDQILMVDAETQRRDACTFSDIGPLPAQACVDRYHKATPARLCPLWRDFAELYHAYLLILCRWRSHLFCSKPWLLVEQRGQ